MSGAAIRRTTFQAPPAWGKLCLAAAVALGTITATVFIVPSWESSAPVAARAPSPSPSAPSAQAAAPAAPGTGAGGGGGGGGSAGAGASSSGSGGEAHGLRPAAKPVYSAVVAGVAAIAPLSVDSVLVADSDATWAVAHIAPTTGNHGLFILAHQIGSWSSIESGYPQMPCDEAVPTGVQADLGLLMASCG